MDGQSPTNVRRAGLDDAALIKRAFEMAGEGMPEHFWNQARQPGQSVEDVALARMRDKIRDPAQYVTVAGDGLAAMVSYDIGPEPEPVSDLSPLIQPLVALENRALGSHYINMVAVMPEARRMGLGRALIRTAFEYASRKPVALIVSDTNHRARALYEDEGFRAIASEPQISHGWQARGERYILMVTGI